MAPSARITGRPRFWQAPGTPWPSAVEAVPVVSIPQPHPGVQVALVAWVWVATGSAGDMGGAGLCLAHISPSALFLLKWVPKAEVLSKREA